MARCPIHRRKAVGTVISMFCKLLLRYLKLKMLVLEAIEARKGLEFRPSPTSWETPFARQIARNSFMSAVTAHGDISSTMLIRMNCRAFQKLCNLLRYEGGLRRSCYMDIDEMVAIFLYTIAHNEKNRVLQVTFRRSGETICRVFKLVLLSVLKLHKILLRKPIPIPENSTDAKWKHFKNCLGALDGTIISVRAPKETQERYHTHKGTIGMNVLGVCNTNMEFIYCLAGWEGSAHDGRVLRDALIRPDGLKVPKAMTHGDKEVQSENAQPAAGKVKSEYTSWTEEQDATLIEAMLELTESREFEGGKFKLAGFRKLESMIGKKMPQFNLTTKNIQSRHRYFKTKYAGICEVQSGSCSGFGWDESKKRVVADDDVFNEWIKSHPDCKGLNKKPFIYFNQLSRIFGKDRAMGGEAQTAASVKESPPAFCGSDQNAVPVINLDEETSQRILEDMINEGVDHRTLLNNEVDIDKPKSATSNRGNKKARHEKNDAVITGVTAEIEKLQPMMEQTAMDVHRIANSFCMEDDLIARRRTLFEEISKVEGLTRKQAIKAAMVLVKDVTLTDLYY